MVGSAYISSTRTPECFEFIAKTINGQCQKSGKGKKKKIQHKDHCFGFSVTFHIYLVYNRSIHTNFSSRRLQNVPMHGLVSQSSEKINW